MKNYIIKPISSNPGIQRDGTPFASQSYIDGQWCRFYMNRPRKIGGYKLVDPGNSEIIRTLYGVPKPDKSADIYLGRVSGVFRNNISFDGVSSGEIDRTPTDYASNPNRNPNNVWQFDTASNALSAPTGVLTPAIVATVIPNGNDINNETEGNLYYGDTNSNDPLTQINFGDLDPVKMSGGVIYFPRSVGGFPILVVYGNNGLLRWSDPTTGDIKDFKKANNSIVANSKIIQAYRYRGSNPQLLCWTVNSVVSVSPQIFTDDDGSFLSFVGTTIQDNITVMSPNSIVEYNQQFFWPGLDQFYVYNGIVNRLDNSMSRNWFFNYINLEQRTKVFGMAVPLFDEIWWFYPRNSQAAVNEGINDATECNAVVIYNVRLNIWYDSFLSRAAGLSTGVFPNPLMSDSDGRGVIDKYGLWMHEYGVDKEIEGTKFAINSYFETRIFTLFEGGGENNRLMRSRRIEPDFDQAGDMTVTVNNRMFSSDTLQNGRLLQTGPITFNPNTDKIDDVVSQGRLVSYVFRSNTAGGTYQGGETLLDYEVGDVHP